MPPHFASRTLALGDLLSDLHDLRVPDYQRPYSWTVDEAAQLLDDIAVAIGEQTETGSLDDGYFLGSVLLIETAGQTSTRGGHPTYEIVDGQQRLITITILLSVIRDIADDRGLPLGRLIEPHIWRSQSDSGRPRLAPRYAEAQFLRTFVQEPGASTLMPESEDLPWSQARIIEVREHLAETLVTYADADLATISSYLLGSCFLSTITTDCIDRAHRIFTVLNNRGRPLTRNDILKAQILGAIPQGRRQAYTEQWDAMEQGLGKAFESLFSHIRVAEGHGKGRVLHGISDLIAANGDAETFFQNVLSPYASIYSTILDLGREAFPDHPAIVRYLTYLNWLSSEDWAPSLMLYWRQVEGDPARLEAMLQRIDRFAYGLRLLGIGTDKRLTRFSGVLAAVRNGTVLNPSEPALDFSREDLRNIQFNLRSLHTRNQATCKLVLLRLNDRAASQHRTINPADYTVEHVLPQKPGRNSEWRTWFANPEEREACTQSLGNLVLINRADNERAKNLDLAKKLDVYFQRDADEVLAITRDLQGLTEWRASAVKEREEQFINALNEMWSLLPKSTSSDTHARASELPRRRSRKAAV